MISTRMLLAPASRLTMLVASLIAGAACSAPIVQAQPQDRSIAGSGCNSAHQFYFEPTSSCQDCSELTPMFDNYAKWLEDQLAAASAAAADSSAATIRSERDELREGEVLKGSSRLMTANSGQQMRSSTRTSYRDKSDSGNGKTANNTNEVSIFKSNPQPTSGGDNYHHNGGSVVDVALSRLINLDEGDSSQLGAGAASARSTSPEEYGSQSSQASSSAYLDADVFGASSSTTTGGGDAGSDSGLDQIRGQTREMTKFVSQFVKFHPTIGGASGDHLFRVMDECRQNENASACQMWSNLCVITMYSYSDAPSPKLSNKADHQNGRYHHHHHHNERNHEQQLPPSQAGSSSHEQHQQQSGKGLYDGWRHCKQFNSLTSICNSLRDWHRQERRSTGPDNALQSVYATLDEPFTGAASIGSAAGGGGGSLPSPGLVIRPNQPLQLLAYSYSFEGNLIGIDQFGPHEMERFCLRSATSNRKQRPIRQASGGSGYFRFGKNMKLQGCQLSELEAFQMLEGGGKRALNQTQFVDLYIAYQAGGSMLIKPVPVLLKNLLYNGNLINQKYSKDPSRWRLVHRFIYHALISTRTPNLGHKSPGADGSSRDTTRTSEETAASNNDYNNNEELQLLYAKSVVLDLKFRKLDKGALLSSILLTIDYGLVSRSFDELAPFGQSTSTPSSSSSSAARQQNNLSIGAQPPPLDDNLLVTNLLVEQTLIDMQVYKKDLDLAITILSILSSIWSLLKCYNIQKCYGNVKLDLESLIRFVIIGCDTVALLLLAVLFLFVSYLFVLLKFQHSSVQVLAPNEQLEGSLMLQLQLAFVFKLIGLANRLYVHLNADIFFVDWERPRMLTSSQILNLNYQQQQMQLQHLNDEHAISTPNKLDPTGRPAFFSNQQPQPQQQQQQQNSFWRPYTVINRWFQMQTLRRLDLTLQLLAFLLLMHLTQLNRLAGADLSLNLSSEISGNNIPANQLVPRESLVFRALLFCYLYLGLAGAQILYKKYFHEPWIRDSVREFVDLCSVANVSVFLWLYPRFGYYIHGRNANGSGDRGIGEMNALLEREERDLCSKRGLAPNSDQQVFVLVLPRVINDHYRNLLSKEQHHTSLANRLSHSHQSLLGKQQMLFNGDGNGNGNNNGGALFPPPSALNLSASSLSVAGSSPSPAAASGGRSRIDGLMAKHKSIQQFLTNFLEHVYKDIDYAIREARRFENLLLLDLFDFNNDDEALIALPANNPAARSSTSANPATQPTAQLTGAGNRQHQMGQQAAAFYKDRQNAFTSLLWFGLELDLVLVELLSFLLLDYWLEQPALLSTASLLWFLHHAFKAIYLSCARYNLITKALIDEKFLFSG